MNADVFQERWGQVRSEAQRRWNKLSDEDLEGARGQVDRLVGTLEERYGWDRQKAEKQVNHFMERYGDDLQARAQGIFAAVSDFVNENPWAGILAAVLILGLVTGLLARPNMRNRYY